MSNSVIAVGNTFRIYDSSVQTYDQLPVDTYRVHFNPMAGFSLVRTTDLRVGEEKVYGKHRSRVRRIAQTYRALEGSRSLGVMLSGDKGMGKSLMLRMLAEAAITDLGMPVVIVDIDAEGIAEFIDSLGEVLVIFDEFEKVFPTMDADEMNAQHKFLGLFDGMSTASRLYALSVNELHNVSDYLLNRPGRFHYHMRFDYPAPDEVRQYLQDQAPSVAGKEVSSVVSFSQRVPLNYDHLRAIAFELETLGGTFEEVIGDLNIKRVDRTRYAATVQFSNGLTLRSTPALDLFDTSESPETAISVEGLNEFATVLMDITGLQEEDDRLVLSPEYATVLRSSFPSEDNVQVVSLELRLLGSKQIGF